MSRAYCSTVVKSCCLASEHSSSCRFTQPRSSGNSSHCCIGCMRPLPPDAGPSGLADHGIAGLLTNPTLLAALLSCVAAQIAKPIAHYYSSNEKRWDWTWAISPGGMPSSHTGGAWQYCCAVPVCILWHTPQQLSCMLRIQVPHPFVAMSQLPHM